jgi:two-component system, NtrC family, sensor kinase
MVITKELEEEIKAFMDNYWNNYLEGDIQKWSTFITDDYKNIGGTEEEIWNSKKEIIDYTMQVVHQMVGVSEFRNKRIQVFSLSPYILAHEFSDIFIKIENEWVFYGKFRISSIIQRSETGLLVVHQHGSYPDSKTEPGEALAFDKIRTENKELRDAVKRRTIELENKTHALENAMANLKATQAQLIQSEKMASLGELTAGIAHEIQNPLNFVNNFSEVSKELIGEMNEELAVGNMQMAKEIAADIEQNLEKINHHGKRAADIVKGMLQHSLTSSGVKEPTDINALADEYLRLSYHGLRAKDKSFNADYKTDFDPNLPKINIIPQDIGRVLLNLINNAFYAVLQRQKTLTGLNSGEPYKPTVTVSTKNLGDWIEISVKDNGPGIPAEIKDKIFQPFFTTKPTGQGTGLGLSLSYDIVKAHGGELKVETNEGEGSSFIIQLPI